MVEPASLLASFVQCRAYLRGSRRAVSVLVVDASVLLKWFVPEVHSDAARRWLQSSHEYLAPDLIFPEAGNAIWKKVRREELDEDEGRRLADDVARAAVETIPMRGLLPDAEALALA